MHAKVGFSLRPWLTSTTTAANSSVGSLSTWGTTSLSRPARFGSEHLSTARNLKQWRVLWTGRRAVDRGFCGDTPAERVDLLRGESPQTGWGWRNHWNRGLRFGLSDTANEGREVVVPRARRGFLTELQSVKDEAGVGEPVEFESPLEIVMYPDSRLRNKNRRISVFDQRLEKLVQEMLDIMYKTDGVGLAAPQVGVNVQVMVYNPEGERGKGAEYILVNPKIVKYSKLRDIFREGCLSFSPLEANVERPVSVRVEAQDIKGKKFGISLKGWQARIFQHEYDHLEGILYHDRMTSAEIDSIRPGLVELEEQYEKRTGLSAPERISRVGLLQ